MNLGFASLIKHSLKRQNTDKVPNSFANIVIFKLIKEVKSHVKSEILLRLEANQLKKSNR